MRVVVLGATGSVGRQTAEVVAGHPEQLSMRGLVAHRDVDTMARLAARLRPDWVVMTDPDAAARLKAGLAGPTRVEAGMERVLEHLEEDDPLAVVAAMSGFVGLEPTLAAARRGHRLALANKETLVAAGALVKAAVAEGGGRLYPVDSEHSAIFQAIGDPPRPFQRIWITATGGPFRGFSREQLARVTAKEALNHPVWRMGPKITVDSATLMNKGLEVLEAHWLFDAPLDKIEVVVHPEAVVHSLVEFWDGAILAQLGTPDMRLPIQLALSWPERWPVPGAEPLDLPRVGAVRFEPLNHDLFRGVRLARRAADRGDSAPVVLNAANEVAVERFLAGEIRFLDVTRLVEDVLETTSPMPIMELAAVRAADAQARAAAREWQA
jgi:1-deoxy-D-xylulose-5-phosphate reductoisomerase